LTAHGFGKVLLFGEHFVVYGCPAIGAALARVTTITLGRSGSGSLEVDFPLPRGQLERSEEAAGIIADALGFEGSGCRFAVQSDIPAGEHLGSSAAFCVAVTRAVAQAQGKKLDQEYIAAVSTRGEKVFHGNSSGVDPMLSAWGGCVYFVKSERLQAEKIKCPSALTLVVASDGQPVSTREMVERVYGKKAVDPLWWEKVSMRAYTLVEQGRQALISGDVSTVGQLMNINHDLLQEIGVSSPLLDAMVTKARDNGAYGAKLTGGGGGGCMIALCADADAQKIVEALMPISSFAFITSIGI